MGERIVLGLGDNTDYEISWDSSVVAKLIVEHGIQASELTTDSPIASVRDLLVSILGFLSLGTGGERFVQSPQIVEEFAGLFENKVTIGGTAVRAAIAMRKLGHRSALHLVTINDHVRRLIPQDSPWVCSRQDDSSFPHLIVQYSAGTTVQAGDISITTARPNRIIYDNDADNIAMRLSPDLSQLVEDAQVFLVSGFNAMRSVELLADRLRILKGVLEKLPARALVFFEDAGYHLPEVNVLTRRELSPLIDIHSLNEDELQGYLGRGVDLLDPADVHTGLQDLSRLLKAPVLVLHTQYWALAFGAHAETFAKPLRGAITMAATRFRFGDDFTVADYDATACLPPAPAGKAFCGALASLAGERVCCLPSVQVPETRVTTIGLGDAFVGGFLPHLIHEETPVYQARRII